MASAATSTESVVTGNLTRDPELRTTPGGTSVCKLRIAVNTRRKDGGRRLGGQAQLLRRHRLGRPGRELRDLPAARAARSPSTGASTGTSGRRGRNKRQAVEIIADTVQFLGSRDGGHGGGGNGNGGGGGFAGGSDLPADTSDFDSAAPAGVGSSAADDDIPF